MYIQTFPLRGLMIFVLYSALVVKALPASQFTPADDELNPLLSDKEQSSEGLDSALLGSDTSSLGTNLYNLQDSPDLLALASTSTDATQSGTEVSPSGNKDLFGDHGPSSDSEDFSLPDDTLAFNDAGSDQINQDASPDLFAGDNPGESSSTPPFSPNLLNPDDKPLLNDFDIPNSANSGESTVLGDDTILNPVDLADASSISREDVLFDLGDSAADISLSGDSSSAGSVDSAEDTSSSVLDKTEGTLVASKELTTLDGSTPPTCSSRKTPACCLSSRAPGGLPPLPGYKAGCTPCMCFSVFRIAKFTFWSKTPRETRAQ